MQKSKFHYMIYDDQGELFRIVKTRWEKNHIMNLYDNFTYVAKKQQNKQNPLELVGECLF